jgi:hypothetical protein
VNPVIKLRCHKNVRGEAEVLLERGSLQSWGERASTMDSDEVEGHNVNVFNNTFMPNRCHFSTQGANSTPSVPIPTHISTILYCLSGDFEHQRAGKRNSKSGGIVSTPSILHLARGDNSGGSKYVM